MRYEVDAASGRVHLTARYAGATDAPTLPAFGLEWTLPKQYENLRFYGLGPEETYRDRLHGGKLGIFERTAAEDNAPYLVPQETGNHEDVRWAEVLDAQGHGMRISQAGSEHCVCSIESGPCERVDVFHVSGRFWSTSACGEKRTPARPAWTSFPS